MVSFEDFKKLDIRVGTVLSAEKIEGSDKLLKLIFDFGAAPVKDAAQSNEGLLAGAQSAAPERQTRQIIAGIAAFFPDPAVLVGQQMPVITNLEPRMLKGFESQGMILAVGVGETAVLLHPESPVPPGSIVR